MIIWWREFDDEPARGNLYHIESYTRRIQKRKMRPAHTHIIEWLLSREAAPEKFIPFLLLDWEIVGRVSWAPIYIVATSLWKQERETDNRKSFCSTPKRWTEDRKKRDTKMKLLFLWIYLAQSAKILVWPAEWSHWINMKVNIHTDCMIQSWIISHLLRNGIRQTVANHYDSINHY